jgi:hypothetical protein
MLLYCAGEKGDISEATASINQRILHRVAHSMVKRVNACVQENGWVCPAPSVNFISGFIVLYYYGVKIRLRFVYTAAFVY